MNKSRVNAFSSASWILVIISLVVLGCGRFGGSKDGGSGDTTKNLAMPTIDPNAPFPVLNTDGIDALIADVPELAKHREAVMAAERDAIKGALDDVRSKSKSVNGPRTAVEIAPVMLKRTDSRAVALFSWPINLTPVAMAADIDLSSLGSMRQTLIGHQIGFFMTDEGRANPSAGTGTKTITMKDEKTGEVQATATVSIDTAGGTYTSEITTKVSMPLFGLDANSKVSLKGDPCPDSNGKVDLLVRSSSNARAGRAGSVFYDKNIEARIVATVGDDANLAGADFDLKQATHSSGSGQQVDFITSQSGNSTGETLTTLKLSDPKIDRGSQFVSPADQKASDVGLDNALNLAIGVLLSARDRWQGGGCIKIEATSPGAVQPSSTTDIPVTVHHKWDGSEVPSKLEALLKGETSVSPTSLAKTTGTLTYTAPGDKGKNATISLTASSRRGRAKLDLSASTGPGKSVYIYGDIDEASQAGEVCDTTVPFTVPGTLNFRFTPTSETTGTYTYSGPYGAKGSGPYEIFGDGRMVLSGEGCIMGHCDSYSHDWKVKSIEPCTK